MYRYCCLYWCHHHFLFRLHSSQFSFCVLIKTFCWCFMNQQLLFWLWCIGIFILTQMFCQSLHRSVPVHCFVVSFCLSFSVLVSDSGFVEYRVWILRFNLYWSCYVAVHCACYPSLPSSQLVRICTGILTDKDIFVMVCMMGIYQFGHPGDEGRKWDILSNLLILGFGKIASVTWIYIYCFWSTINKLRHNLSSRLIIACWLGIMVSS